MKKTFLRIVDILILLEVTVTHDRRERSAREAADDERRSSTRREADPFNEGEDLKQNVDHVRVEGEARWRARPDPRGVQGAFLLRLLLQPDVICNGG